MSLVCQQVPPAIYRSSCASTDVPSPPMAIRGSSSISRPTNERSGLLLGSSLLADDSLFRSFFQEVTALQDDPEEDAPPDSHALAEILRLVPLSRNQLAQRWFMPRISSDGFGGVRLTWRSGQTEVRAVISGGQTTRKSYLYWENRDNYGTVIDFTPTTLLTHLRKQTEGGGA